TQSYVHWAPPITPETSSNLFYVDDAETELVGLTDGPAGVSVRRRRGLFFGLQWRTSARSGGVEGRWRLSRRRTHRLGSLSLMYRSIWLVLLAAFAAVVTSLAISQGNSVLCRWDSCSDLPPQATPPGVQRIS